MKNTEEKRALERLLGDMALLVEQRAENVRYEWRGGKIDLMEALHILFIYNKVSDDEGRPLSFSAIVSRACHNLGISVPSNARAYVQKAERRKGVRQRPLLDRYRYREDWLTVFTPPCDGALPVTRERI